MSKRTKRKFSWDFKLAAVKKHVENGLAALKVAGGLEISENLIYAWKKNFQNDGSLESQLQSSSSVNAELNWLRDEVRQLRMERDILKKATVFFAREQKKKYRFILVHEAALPIEIQYRVLEVSRSGYSQTMKHTRRRRAT